ncbi:MAG: glycosyltransferase [Firmicutes bacterium]|nr:glycosyltransferase [Bacillota bacterium]
MLKKVKLFFRKIKRIPGFFIQPAQHARFIYCKYYEKTPIDENTAIFQSFTGSSLSCSPYYILQELYRNPKYNHMKLFVAADKTALKNIRMVLDNSGMENVQILILHSRKYCKVLAEAKYLVNNSTFPTYFIKKEGQIYVNTWHGTPLKSLGRHILNAPNEIGNTQRNFLCADYLIHPNDFTFEKIRNSYMLDNLFNGEHIISGYPRNSILFDKAKRKRIRKQYGLSKKKVIIYMPTWRGSLNALSNQASNDIAAILDELDKLLDEKTVFYAKLHALAKGSIDFEKYNKIKPFPEECETYEFLTAADCLITDYSSVFFDFAVTGRKIVLYPYDKDEYISEHGLYMDYDSLPFPIVQSIEQLAEQLKDINDYPDYSKSMRKFVQYDSKDVTKNICEYIFGTGDKGNLKIIPASTYHNGKDNVVIFTGSLAKNGITSALKSLANMIDCEKRNYTLLFSANSVNRAKMTIHDFPGFDYMPIQGRKVLSYSEALCRFIYYFFQKDFGMVNKVMDRIMNREIKRLFNNIHFDYLIHYSGYEKDIMEVFARMDGKKAIYIHNDLIAESRTKGNLDVKCVEKAYNRFDKIVAIREGTKEELVCSSDEIRDKVILTHNLIDYKTILDKANQKLVFDISDEYTDEKGQVLTVTDATECNISQEELEDILNDNSTVKFINIGRFSYEKGHERLIHAFEQVHEKYPKTKLIIIGGYGAIYDTVRQQVSDSVCSDDIVIIKSLSNVFPVLAKCSAFVLSSYYEGLPVTIMEALVLGKTVISTDIVGPRQFLRRGYGYLVEESEDGLANGMCKFIEGTLPEAKFFDAEEFNRNAIAEFEAIFED